MYLHTENSPNTEDAVSGSRGIWLLYMPHILLVIATAFPVFHSIFR